MRKYQARVRGHCLGMLGNTAEADDAAQEIFIKAYRGLGSFGGRGGFSTWLYRITVNHCRDCLRSAMRRKTESWEKLREEEGEFLETRTAVMPQGQMADGRLQHVREALDKLPEAARTILILREVQGLSYQELADTLRCSVDAVKARLRRARQELEARFEEVVRG
ncbi:MAG: RNA polymerase sigma factor [Candidatus Omnitrophica bacterium]|nr:RNA polymerase sigma factor [Candidatus Omnitrophota bacterium]